MHVEAARSAGGRPGRGGGPALALLLETHPALRDEVPEPDLRRLLLRQLAILKYVEFRFRPKVRVSDEEVRKSGRRSRPGARRAALEDEEEAIRERLERQALDERIRAWVKELRARATSATSRPPRRGP